MTENVEIVASFPVPPKQFYENLTEEEILSTPPPPFPDSETEKLIIFGSEQSLKIENKNELILTDTLVEELKSKKEEIFTNYKKILENIESVQDPTKINDLIKLFEEPFQKVFEITSKLSIIQAAVSLKKSIEEEFEEIDEFVNKK